MASDVITLRAARESDLAMLEKLISTSYVKLLKAGYPPSVQVTALPIIARANPALVTSGTYHVATFQERLIVGAGGWTRSIKGRDVADVRHFVTHHEFLRQGIGRRLMDVIVSEARTAGIRRLDCLATRTAVPFYRALGFQGDREVSIGLRPGVDFPAVRMRRAI